MLSLETLLKIESIDPRQVMVMRHRPTEPAMRRALPWIVAERANLFLAYQQLQWSAGEKMMSRAKVLASFVGQEPGFATFAGLFSIGAAEPCSYDAYWAMPENVELVRLGMSGRAPGLPDHLKFDLRPIPAYAAWIGKLVIAWPPLDRSWLRWANKNVMPIAAIHEESAFVRAKPQWDTMVLTWSELGILPGSWRAALAEWRGIYFIFDQAKRAGYIGSASGPDNILDRWLNYAATVHGGNVGLRDSRPEDLRFSILQRTSPDLAPPEVVELEGNWKDRLHTRQFGLNEN